MHNMEPDKRFLAQSQLRIAATKLLGPDILQERCGVRRVKFIRFPC